MTNKSRPSTQTLAITDTHCGSCVKKVQAAMAMSSVTVVSGAGRLRWFKPE